MILAYRKIEKRSSRRFHQINYTSVFRVLQSVESFKNRRRKAFNNFQMEEDMDKTVRNPFTYETIPLTCETTLLLPELPSSPSGESRPFSPGFSPILFQGTPRPAIPGMCPSTTKAPNEGTKRRTPSPSPFPERRGKRRRTQSPSLSPIKRRRTNTFDWS